jgi:hypothetical protein
VQERISDDYTSRSVIVQLVYQWLAEQLQNSCGVSNLIVDAWSLSVARDAVRPLGAAPDDRVGGCHVRAYRPYREDVDCGERELPGLL